MKTLKIFWLGAMILMLTSCKKYLEEKSSTTLSVASTINDAQLLMDAERLNTQLPQLGEAFTDNYYYLEPYLTQFINVYTFSDALYQNDYSVAAWGNGYNSIYYTNLALETIDKIREDNDNRTSYRNVKGMAHFFRSFYFYKLAENFTKSYDDIDSKIDLGIPLRLKTDIEAPSVRSTVEQTYKQIINDGLIAVANLPSTQTAITRPSKATAYGLMARVYLSMRKYKQAGEYADSCLQLQPQLLDFNKLNANLATPIAFPSVELITVTTGASQSGFASRTPVDTNLYKSYSNNDLRKIIFYTKKADNAYYFKGSYSRFNNQLYTGLTTAEMYLIRAECFARNNELDDALADLNSLMKNRIAKNAYVPYMASSAQEALQLILTERRKELVFRDLRWMDIKRLNREGANISITRVVNGKTYTLPANSPRFALPLPTSVVNLTGMPQNPK